MNAPAEAPHGRCRNCEALLHGPYCAACGQATHGSARSLGTLLHDVWHDLTHLDGRVWRTLRALALRPGHLTEEYLLDRRARYVPPFRLYLVLSVAFFAIATAGSAPAERGLTAEGLAETRRQLEETARELEASGQRGAASALRAAADPQPSTAAGSAELERACAALGAGVDIERIGGRFEGACRAAVADGGRAVAHAFLVNVPKTMLLFLPVVALVLFTLFGRSRRFYVEHLVLVLHLQSALFLAVVLLLAIEAALRWAGAPVQLSDALDLAAGGYGAWYAYRALRDVYGEPRASTLAKLAVVGVAYFTLLAMTLLGTVAWSALQA